MKKILKEKKIKSNGWTLLDAIITISCFSLLLLFFIPIVYLRLEKRKNYSYSGEFLQMLSHPKIEKYVEENNILENGVSYEELELIKKEYKKVTSIP